MKAFPKGIQDGSYAKEFMNEINSGAKKL